MTKTKSVHFSMPIQNTSTWSLRDAQEKLAKENGTAAKAKNMKPDCDSYFGLSLTDNKKYWWNTPNRITPSNGVLGVTTETYDEIYSGSVIDRIIFSQGVSEGHVTPANEPAIITCVEVSKLLPEKAQLENRVNGLIYLKKLWNSFKKWDLTFPESSKYPGLTKGEIEFLEDVNNLQNYKPIQNHELDNEVSNDHNLTQLPSEIVAKKPDLSKWKPRKMSYKMKSPSEWGHIQIKIAKCDKSSEVSTALTIGADRIKNQIPKYEMKQEEDLDDFSVIFKNIHKRPEFEEKYMKSIKRSLSEAKPSKKTSKKRKSSSKLKVYNWRKQNVPKSQFSTSSSSSICRSTNSVYDDLDLSSKNLTSIVKSLAWIEESLNQKIRPVKKLRKRRAKKKSGFNPSFLNLSAADIGIATTKATRV